MLHKPVIETKKDNASNYKMRLGVVMFIIYGVIYSGFVAINLIKASLMSSIVIFGLNLAVVYGFGLIIFALILALIYNNMCTKKEKELNTPKNNK